MKPEPRLRCSRGGSWPCSPKKWRKKSSLGSRSPNGLGAGGEAERRWLSRCVVEILTTAGIALRATAAKEGSWPAPLLAGGWGEGSRFSELKRLKAERGGTWPHRTKVKSRQGKSLRCSGGRRVRIGASF